MIPGLILTWLRGNWRWLLPATACLGLGGALWWQNNAHALETAKSATVIANLETSVANCKAASSQALAETQAAYRKKEKESAENAIASSRANDDRIRMHTEKMRAYIHKQSTSGAAKSSGAGLSEGASTDTKLVDGVIVSIADMEICTENTAKLESAVEWAAGLSEKPLP